MAEATKKDILKMIERMPDDASIEDVMYELYVHAEVEAGLEDIRAGRVVPHAEVMREFSKWLQSTGQ